MTEKWMSFKCHQHGGMMFIQNYLITLSTDLASVDKSTLALIFWNTSASIWAWNGLWTLWLWWQISRCAVKFCATTACETKIIFVFCVREWFLLRFVFYYLFVFYLIQGILWPRLIYASYCEWEILLARLHCNWNCNLLMYRIEKHLLRKNGLAPKSNCCCGGPAATARLNGEPLLIHQYCELSAGWSPNKLLFKTTASKSLSPHCTPTSKSPTRATLTYMLLMIIFCWK